MVQSKLNVILRGYQTYLARVALQDAPGAVHWLAADWHNAEAARNDFPALAQAEGLIGQALADPGADPRASIDAAVAAIRNTAMGRRLPRRLAAWTRQVTPDDAIVTLPGDQLATALGQCLNPDKADALLTRAWPVSDDPGEGDQGADEGAGGPQQDRAAMGLSDYLANLGPTPAHEALVDQLRLAPTQGDDLDPQATYAKAAGSPYETPGVRESSWGAGPVHLTDGELIRTIGPRAPSSTESAAPPQPDASEIRLRQYLIYRSGASNLKLDPATGAMWSAEATPDPAGTGPGTRWVPMSERQIALWKEFQLNSGSYVYPTKSPEERQLAEALDGRAPAPPNAPLLPEIPGFPQTGKDAWRAANDWIFIQATNAYNQKHGFQPSDPEYWPALRLKAQAMKESGGSKKAFDTDPLQVNNFGDKAADKTAITGIIPHQPMTPALSAAAALEWLRHKGHYNDHHGLPGPWLGAERALFRYNTKEATYGIVVLKSEADAERAWRSTGPKWQWAGSQHPFDKRPVSARKMQLAARLTERTESEQIG